MKQSSVNENTVKGNYRERMWVLGAIDRQSIDNSLLNSHKKIYARLFKKMAELWPQNV